jgi:cytochrome c2
MSTRAWTAAGVVVIAVVVVIVIGIVAGRGGSDRVPSMPGADAGRGASLISAFGCGACHSIHGIDGADAHVGPPLVDLVQRRVIAGRLANTPRNLAYWIAHPQRVDPGNVMPDLGLSEQQASDIALYLYEHP